MGLKLNITEFFRSATFSILLTLSFGSAFLAGCGGGGGDGGGADTNTYIQSGSGTIDDPYVGNIPLDHSHSVDTNNLVYYRFNHSSTGAFVSNLTVRSGDADLYVLDSAGKILCNSLGRYSARESCQVEPTTDQVFVVISGYQTTEYSLEVGSDNPFNGTWGNPVLISSAYDKTVDLLGSDARYYVIDLQRDVINTIQLSSTNVDLNIFKISTANPEPEYMCGSYQGSDSVKSCDVVNASGSVLIEASSTVGGRYSLHTEVNSFVGYGTTEEPYIINTPFWYEGNVKAKENLVFSTQTPVSDTLGVSLSGLTNNADLLIYDNVDDSLICESLGRKNASESCLLPGGSSLRINIQGIEDTGIKLMSQPDWALKGTWGNPLSETMPFSLQSSYTDNIPLYYLVTGEPSKIYQASGSGKLSLWDGKKGMPLCHFVSYDNFCFINPATGSVFMEVDSHNFDIEVIEALDGDGSFDSPYIDVAPSIQAGSTNITYESRYHVVAVTPGAMYRVNFNPDNSGGWQMRVFDGLKAPAAPDSYATKPLCNWDAFSSYPDCIVQSDSGLIFVELRGGYATSYSLSVSVAETGDGSVSSPFLHNLSSSGMLEINGSLSSGQNRFDMMWLPTGSYVVSFEGDRMGSQLLDSRFISECRGSDYVICTIRSTGTIARFEFTDSVTGSFNFSIRTVNEPPVDLPLSGAIPYSDINTLSSGSTVFYRFGATIRGRYNVTLGNLSADAKLYVYGRTHIGPGPEDYSGPPYLLCADLTSGTTNKSCEVNMLHNEIIVAVAGMGTTGYTLDVVAPLGSLDNPITGSTPYQHDYAPVTTDTVYYQFSTTTGTRYLVSKKTESGVSHFFRIADAEMILIPITPDHRIVDGATVIVPYQILVKEIANEPYTTAGQIQLGQTITGHLEKGEALAFSLDIIPRIEYTVSLTGLTGDGDLVTFYYAGVYCSSRQAGTLDETCTFWDLDGTGEFVIYGYEATDFTLTVTAPEGSLANPIIGTIPYTSTRTELTGGLLYYQFPITSGENYLLSYSTSNDTDLYIDVLGETSTYCYLSGYFLNKCLISQLTDMLTLGVSHPTGVEVTFTVEPTISNTPASPLTGTIPYTASGGLLAGEIEYHLIPAQYAQQYDVSLSGLTGDADLYVFRGQGGRLLCVERTVGTIGETCSFLSYIEDLNESGGYDILVGVQAKTDSNFNLSVIASP